MPEHNGYKPIPPEHDYHSGEIVVHRIIHDACCGFAGAFLAHAISSSEWATILGAVVGILSCEFVLNPYVWSKVKDLPTKK